MPSVDRDFFLTVQLNTFNKLRFPYITILHLYK